jgi:hypothetical protein
MSSRIAILLILAAGCSTTEAPDARVPAPNLIDGALAVDARPADARAVDSGPGAADAAPGAPDASPATPDAPPATPDAAPTPDGSTEPGAAKLIINEVAPNVADDMDLVELLVVEAGSTRGIQLWQDFTAATELLAVLPTLAVDAGQIIVVHLQNPDALTETESREECTDPACYDAAWDVAGEPQANRSIGYSYRLLYLLDADEAILDAVPFTRRLPPNLTGPDAFPADLAHVIDTGDWKTPCAEPCDYTNRQNLFDATVNWTDAGTSPTGSTIQRKTDSPDTDTIADWNATTTASSLGEPNP